MLDMKKENADLQYLLQFFLTLGVYSFMYMASVKIFYINDQTHFYVVLHSGQAAVITPRRVTSGLGSRRVKTIAAAKHHTVLATEGGEVFTWGSNRGKIYYDNIILNDMKFSSAL